MKHFLVQFFHFSRLERLGTVALLLLCGLIYLAPEMLSWFLPRRSTDFNTFQADIQVFREKMKTSSSINKAVVIQLFEFDPNMATQADFENLGLAEKVAATIIKYRDKGGQFRQAEDLRKIYSLAASDFERLRPWIRVGGKEKSQVNQADSRAIETFFFDPNSISEADLYRLGLADRTIKGILNYRSKGGKFRKKEDFAKIYTLAESDYNRLEPYIAISTLVSQEALRPVTYTGSSSFPERKKTLAGPLDINRAAVEDWIRLPGIGERRAQQLVKFRESLGGFLTVAQVSELYGLPDSIFQKIQPQLVIEFSTIRQININTVSVEDLDHHPYISLKQATLIVNYRTQHGPFASVDDLGKIIVFTDKKWLDKIKPYLAVQ